MKGITSDELKKLPKLSTEELDEIRNFKHTDYADCPPLTGAEFATARKAVAAHPEWYADQKNEVRILS
ncbi:MAG: hypothetical protein IJ228_13430 [Succinivibrio sp.]|nr:hypothetical protein [Succinivibrio sp.]